MRVIDTGLGEIRTAAVSPEGRLVAAAGANGFRQFHWATGDPISEERGVGASEQLAFAPGGAWAARVFSGRLWLEGRPNGAQLPNDPQVRFTGGVAVSSDGRELVATNTRGYANEVRLDRWALPALKPLSGFAYWSPFRRLAYSPDGEFLGGVWDRGFELRFANSGGLDYRHRMPRDHDFRGPGFVSFDRDSNTCAFGWAREFHVLDISTGTSKPGPRVVAEYRDAAFLPGADRFATVGADGLLRLWNPQNWQVMQEYAWGCGPLTALTFTADGAAGVCGTADGRLVQFDVDE